MSRINIIFLVAFVGALVAVFLQSADDRARVQKGFMSLFKPAIEKSTELDGAIENFGDQKYTIGELSDLLNEAQKERDKLRLEVLKLDELAEENNALRRALNYVEQAPLKLVPSQVIGRKPTTWYNTMVIDKGSNDLIERDSPVIVPVGDYAGLVGKVSQVTPNTSVIILLTDEMCQVSARIEGTAEQGILSGQRGSLRVLPDLYLKFLPKNAAAEPGRKVISSGAGDLFPANLLLGEISEFKPGSIDAQAIVKPSVKFDDLKNVFVILPETPAREVEPEPGAGEDEEAKTASNSSPVETTQVSSPE